MPRDCHSRQRFGKRCHKSTASFVLCVLMSRRSMHGDPGTQDAARSQQRISRREGVQIATVLIFGTITDATAAEAARRLIALDSDSSEPIDVIVSSPGGHLESGDTIHDLIRFVRAPVPNDRKRMGRKCRHSCVSGGTPRASFCLPNTRFLIHQPSAECRSRQRHRDPGARKLSLRVSALPN